MPSSSTSLASWIKESYDTWSKMRNKKLTPKWMRNLKLFSGEDIEKQFKTAGDEQDDVSWKSKTFIKIIKVKVMMAYSLLVDVLLGNGQIPFKLTFDDFMQDAEQYDDDQLDEVIEQMTSQIRQWHKDRHADREMMKSLFSMCLYGEGWQVLNGEPIQRPNGEVETVRGWDYISVWNMVWDMESADFNNPKKCQGVIEHEYVSAYELWLLTQAEEDKDSYYEEAITTLISASKESIGDAKVSTTDTDNLPPAFRDVLNRKRNIQRMEFWGRAPVVLVKDFLEQMEKIKTLEELTEMHDYIEEYDGAEIEIVAELGVCGQQEHIIRLDFNESGKRPYKRCLLELTLDGQPPSGVADNLEDIQVSLNGMIRSFEDNKKLSANVIIAVIAKYLPPGAMKKIYEGKLLELQKSDIDDIRKVIQPFVIPDVGETLLSGIALTRNLADLVSQLPSILQGEMLTKQKPDTAYEMSQLLEGAGKYLGQAVKNIDEMFIEDEVKELLDYIESPVNLKVNATGFQSYQDKVIQFNRLMKVLQIVLSDEVLAGEAKLRKHLDEIYKASDLDPDDFLKSDDEKQDDLKQQELAKMQALEEQVQLMAEEARAKAVAEAEAKAEIERVKGEESRTTEEVKGDEERETSEQEFHQDIVLQGLEAQQDMELEIEKAKHQPKQTPTAKKP